MTKKSNSTCIAVLSGLILVACLAVLAAGLAAAFLPAKAQQSFGPPASNLSLIQRLYLSARLLQNAGDLTRPKDPYAADQAFQVDLGQSTQRIAGELQSQGLIPNAGAFLDYLSYTGLDTTLQAGQYTLSAKMTPIEIAQQLQDATPAEVTFRILPGWRLEEIAAALPTSGLEIDPQEFLAAAQEPHSYNLEAALPGNTTLEGFLLPGEYRLPRQISTEEFIQQTLDQFHNQVDNDFRSGFEMRGLNLFEAVILASIVEREAVVDEEMPLIASVFYNRLALGMKLDSDPTVQYALGFDPVKETWWTNPLSLDDLQVDSPYNTYQNTGLPPGPIANPGLSALRAVAFPAQTPYYYFRAACDSSGRHVFAETFAEHLQNECP